MTMRISQHLLRLDRKSEAYSVSHDENATMIQLSGELHV